MTAILEIWKKKKHHPLEELCAVKCCSPGTKRRTKKQNILSYFSVVAVRLEALQDNALCMKCYRDRSSAVWFLVALSKAIYIIILPCEMRKACFALEKVIFALLSKPYLTANVLKLQLGSAITRH